MRCVTQHPICLVLGLARAFTCAIQSAVITADLAKIQTAPPRNEIDCIDQREVGSLRAMAPPPRGGASAGIAPRVWSFSVLVFPLPPPALSPPW